eukprot:1513678-Alexandrium_andersonii.AAC.1
MQTCLRRSKLELRGRRAHSNPQSANPQCAQSLAIGAREASQRGFSADPDFGATHSWSAEPKGSATGAG